MVKYCRDQARDELWLMMGGGAAAGGAGGIPVIGAFTFNTALQRFRLLWNIVFLLAPLLAYLSALRMYLIAAGSAVTVVQAAVVNRIAQVYNVDLIAAGGAGGIAGAIIAMGGGQLLFRMGGIIAGFVPGIGQFVQPTIGVGAVKAFGEAAIAYFENMHPNKIYGSD
ncbi:hypothetical protein [Nostoc commune]|uniref:hypothetical protein n=1 Tax=Nostoc commune TaxID=1178 RepID=UPI001E5EB71A|nr:hypothetical protein [Nostoc commune]